MEIVANLVKEECQAHHFQANKQEDKDIRVHKDQQDTEDQMVAYKNIFKTLILARTRNKITVVKMIVT